MKTRTAMKTWMTALALTAAGTMLATSAFAQTGAGSPPASTGTDVKSVTDTEKGTAPAANPSISPGKSGSTTGATGSDVKSDAKQTALPASTGTDVKSVTDAEKGTAPAASPSISPSKSGSTTGATGSDVKSDVKKTALPERTAQATGSPEQVKAVQQALKDKGHDPGDVDGKMGPKTQAALRDFQQKEGLKATGQADAETMAKLGVEAKTGAVDSSSSSPAASPSDTGTSKDATPGGAKQSK